MSAADGDSNSAGEREKEILERVGAVEVESEPPPHKEDF
jgi:hypothetical protein